MKDSNSKKWRILFTLSLAELLGMGVWFSATAVIPSLQAEWGLSSAGTAWLTMSVQIGFVVGTLLSAVLNISDIFNARYVFTISAFLGGLFNGSIGLFVNSIEPAIVLRFLTGVCLAGVYPPGMKIMATWFKKGRGMAIGMLVGALTVGSASPHLFKVFGNPDWHDLMFTASIASLLAGMICIFFVADGPYQAKAAKFDWKYLGRAMKDRGVRLANFGYLGHMWELYAVWTWIPLFLLESFTVRGVNDPATWSAAGTFGIIAIGGAGCLIAGLLADRYGRTTVTIWSMVISGLCCVIAGFFFGGSPILLLMVCLVWGFAVVADSAQFSASITELVDPSYVGSALTFQTCMGFLLTMITIRLVPVVVDLVTWKWAFSILAIGPVFGVISMYRLKQSPQAAKIGGEKRYY